jgi:hypothetical protein
VQKIKVTKKACLALLAKGGGSLMGVPLTDKEREAMGRPAKFHYGERVLVRDWSRGHRIALVVRDVVSAWVLSNKFYSDKPYSERVLSRAKVLVYFPKTDTVRWLGPECMEIMTGDLIARPGRKTMLGRCQGPPFKFSVGEDVTIRPKDDAYYALVKDRTRVPSNPVSNFYWVVPRQRLYWRNRRGRARRTNRWMPERKVLPFDPGACKE